MSIKTLLAINLVGLVCSIISKGLIKNERFASIVSNIFLYIGTGYALFMVINRPNYEAQQIYASKLQESVKRIASDADSGQLFISSEIENDDTKISAALNKSGLQINALKLKKFKTRSNEDLLTIDKDSYLQFSLLKNQSVISFDNFAKSRGDLSAFSDGIKYSCSVLDEDQYKTNITMNITNQNDNDTELTIEGVFKLKPKDKNPVLFDGSSNKSLSPKEVYNSVKWTGFSNDYWGTYLFGNFTETSLINDGDDRYVFVRSEKVVIPKNSSKSIEFSLLSIPLMSNVLKYYESIGLNGISRCVNFGFFGRLKNAFLYVLEVIFEFTESGFLTLIIFIFLIKLLSLYFDYKTYICTDKLGRLIEMGSFTSNKDVIQAEMKKHSFVLYGAFLYKYLFRTMLFILLYQTMSESIVFYKARFLWIDDISIPDPRSIANLFGLISTDVPLIPKVSLLPIAMMTFLIDRKNLNDPEKRGMVIFIVILMSILLSGFSSIVCLYTIINNAFDKIETNIFKKIENCG